MKRPHLEHIIRACATITSDDEIIVFGSQAILGSYPDAPPDLLVSDEADVFPKNRPELADLVDGTIGELSPFHETYGYYAQGVAEETATLPAGWRDRLVPVRGPGTRGATGWCLDVHDLVVAKVIAGREKDIAFLRTAAAWKLVDRTTLRERLAATHLDEAVRDLAAARIDAAFPKE